MALILSLLLRPRFFGSIVYVSFVPSSVQKYAKLVFVAASLYGKRPVGTGTRDPSRADSRAAPPTEVPSASLSDHPFYARGSFKCTHPGCGLEYVSLDGLRRHARTHEARRPAPNVASAPPRTTSAASR
mgnify:CR=1 FL=1